MYRKPFCLTNREVMPTVKTLITVYSKVRTFSIGCREPENAVFEEVFPLPRRVWTLETKS